VNFFFVIDGELIVKTEWGEVTLRENEFFTVNPPDKHEFQTHGKSAKIIEVAYVKLDPEDINRENLGGPLNLTPFQLPDDFLDKDWGSNTP